jgi:DNA-3-methyladenine glycosylase
MSALKKLKINKDVLLNNILDTAFYERDTSVVAAELIGKILLRQYPDPSNSSSIRLLAGVIIETEAYYGSEDPASHAFRGATKRSKIMFGRAGIAYVYFCYGVHHMLNAVTEREGIPGAVLIRAVKPVGGIKSLMENRKIPKTDNLTDGPGKVTEAFKIDLKDNGCDLSDRESRLNICSPEGKIGDIRVLRAPRIGISKGKEKLLRFRIEDNCFLWLI